MPGKHLATHALIGASGRRVGTRYFYDFEKAQKASGEPYFRWRNDETFRAYCAWASAGRTALERETAQIQHGDKS